LELLNKGDFKMEKLLLNISNHPSREWEDKQKEGWDIIVDIPFPSVGVELSEADIALVATKLFQQIIWKLEEIGLGEQTNVYILLEGEYSLTYMLTRLLLESKKSFFFAFPISERIVKEDGRREFHFSGWRIFPILEEEKTKKKLFAITGFSEDWGAKHLKKKYYGRELTPAEMERNGIRMECHCHYPCMNQLGGEGRYSFTLYSLEVKSDANSLPITLDEPTRIGREGYDVSLLDPWDADPRKNWEEEITETEVVYFYPEIPEPCRSCRTFKGFRCSCDEIPECALPPEFEGKVWSSIDEFEEDLKKMRRGK
jgi:hypothetical protein